MQWYVRLTRALHQRVVAITLETTPAPWVATDQRVLIDQVAPDFWFVKASYGFMEKPDLPELLAKISASNCPVDLTDLTYFIGVEKIVPMREGGGIPRWMARLFGALLRNSTHVTDSMRIPPEQLVDLGREVAI
jgi:KUP system potassium uptake protein